jgi:hypothetical protein
MGRSPTRSSASVLNQPLPVMHITEHWGGLRYRKIGGAETASGRQDHTTSPSADKRSRLWRRPRPSHPLPYVRDDRETPLCVGRDGRGYEVIWVRWEVKFLIFRKIPGSFRKAHVQHAACPQFGRSPDESGRGADNPFLSRMTPNGHRRHGPLPLFVRHSNARSLFS